jgi:hypothetical protein
MADVAAAARLLRDRGAVRPDLCPRGGAGPAHRDTLACGGEERSGSACRQSSPVQLSARIILPM